jgi:DNA invertase Pin-like site-specific DNA recombinase
MQKPVRAALYVRVSSGHQDGKPQESALREYAEDKGWSIVKVYSDTRSGAADSRPALDQLMADCRKRKCDVVLCWRFDRFSRSLRHLIGAMEEFKHLKIAFVSSMENIDTTVPSGQLVFAVIGAIASFERTLICERVKSGLEHARKKGVRLGRPAKKQLTKAEIIRMRTERAKGATLRSLATKFGSSVWAAYQVTRRKNVRV